MNNNPYRIILEKVKELANIWEVINKYNQDRFELIDYTDMIIVVIESIDDLPAASKIIKKAFPKWKYQLQTIWSSGNYGYASWRDPEIRLVGIWLRTPIDEFPLAKLSPNCKFKKKTETFTEYELVCETK